jgi:SAM-dependent methyltransferase
MDRSEHANLAQAKAFYDREFAGRVYTPTEAHQFGYPALEAFVREFDLVERARCVEIGCGRGAYQDLVRDYTGVDLSDTVAQYLRKPFVQASATQLPFPDNTFDATWTIWVFEHVPDPEIAMSELRRVLKPGGLLFFAPAWQCRPWAADGYPVRPYSDFGLGGKLYKAAIPLRNSVAWRAMFMFPRRVRRLAACRLLPGPMPYRYRRIRGNFDKFWMSDSDAINSMDPYEAVLWFASRGDEVLFPATPLRRFLIRTGHMIVRIRK